MFMQNFGVTNKEHYGMLWYFLEWSIAAVFFGERGKTQHMLLVSNDISHFRRFLTMYKLNFE